jgi:YegS/Rv2252/BmrU family lipid kinase
MDTLQHVFIINPVAGVRDQTASLIRSIEAVEQIPEDCRFIETTRYRGHAKQLASRYAANGPVTIYACGGDGTLGEVITGAASGKDCRIAIVPIGTGNDFVKCFGSDNAIKFLDIAALACGCEITVDALETENRRSINIASVGFDAAVTKGVARFKRLPLVSGEMAYLLSTGVNFFSKIKTRCAFEVDGVLIPPSDYIFAIAANGRWYGGGFNASPYSDITDGKIEFIRVPAVSRIKMLLMINDYKKGRHLEKYKFITSQQCSQLRFLSEDIMDVNLDGDIYPMSNPLICIIPGAVRLVVPKGLEESHRPHKKK